MRFFTAMCRDALLRLRPILPWVLLTLLLLPVAASAQSGVFVTTQDRSSLRALPDGAANRLAIVPPETTLPAVGRTRGWIQVEYEGQTGWVVDWLLIWTGDLTTLPDPTISADGDGPQTIEINYTVYATTQDFSSVRRGPGPDFERIEIAPPGTTMPAIGRSADGRWIQVRYNDRNGWIADILLIWTGDIVELTVDGVNPDPFIRRTIVEADIPPDVPLFSAYDLLYPDVTGLFAEETRVELVGRFGSGEFRRLQFIVNGESYWVLNNQITIYGNTFRLPDAAIIVPYGRLLGKLRAGQNLTTPVYGDINAIWTRVASGGDTSCASIPRPVRDIEFTSEDLEAEATFIPAARALQGAINSTNDAIARFEDLCSRTGADRLISPEEVQEVQLTLANARRNLIIVSRFFAPLAERDPLS